MKIRLFQALETAFGWLARWAEQKHERFAICPDCGRNRYTGKPCVITIRDTHGCMGSS